ncbi:MAG: signal peptidase II [Clostridia bacterium]|nr:signal peptidase II [Clostridia bacterium]
MEQTNQTTLDEKKNPQTENTSSKKAKSNSLAGSYLWGILLFFILILIDQLTKAFADVIFIDENGKPTLYELIPGWVNLTITYNRGISFGIGSTASIATKIAVVAMTGVIMLALTVMYFKCDKRRTFIRVALVFVIAGGVGNLIDRVYYQVWDPSTAAAIRDGVRDMVDISALGFGVCNFADFFICGGAAALVAACLFFDTYAYSPKGKYKALQEEAESLELVKAEEKKQKKLLKSEKASEGQATDEPKDNEAEKNG